MTVRLLPALLSAFLLFAAPVLHGQSSARSELARELVVRSGLAEQLRSYPAQVDREIAQAQGRIPDQLIAALREAARASYDPAQLRDDIARTLAADMPEAEMRAALTWLNTEAGRRVTRAEEEATASMSPEAVQAYAASGGASPATRRGQLVAGLIEATRAVDHTARFTESLALGVAVGMDATQPVQNRAGLTVLRERMRVAMPPDKLREAIGASMPPVYGYIYREVSDADLAAYLAFNRSAVGVRYNDAMMKAFTEAMTQASIAMGPLIRKALERKGA